MNTRILAGILLAYIIIAYIAISRAVIRTRTLSGQSDSMAASSYFKWNYQGFLFSHQWLLALIHFVPIGAIIRIIMNFSSDEGNASRALSRPIAYFISQFAGYFSRLFGNTNPAPVESVASIEDIMLIQSLYLDMIERIVRKCAHMIEYGILAALIWVLAYCCIYVSKKYSYIFPFLGVIIIGSIDEYNQSSIDGRWGSPVDVGVDLAGALIAMGIVALCMRLLKRRLSKASNNESVKSA